MPRPASSRSSVSASVRRSIIPDDSLGVAAGNPGDPLFEYSLASARITYLRLVGGYVLPSRTKVERQALVEGTLSLRDPMTSRVLWTADAAHNLVDLVPRGQLPRVEDERFVTGRGRYIDDLRLPAMLHAAFVRSPYAHARIVSVDTSRARQVPGVRAILTGGEVVDTGAGPLVVVRREYPLSHRHGRLALAEAGVH